MTSGLSGASIDSIRLIRYLLIAAMTHLCTAHIVPQLKISVRSTYFPCCCCFHKFSVNVEGGDAGWGAASSAAGKGADSGAGFGLVDARRWKLVVQWLRGALPGSLRSLRQSQSAGRTCQCTGDRAWSGTGRQDRLLLSRSDMRAGQRSLYNRDDQEKYAARIVFRCE